MQFSFTLGDNPPLALIREKLLSVFGPQKEAFDNDPLTQLVAAMLSSLTYGDVAQNAFERMTRRYPAWRLLQDADPKEIEAIIRPVTHADVKAKFIPLALRRLCAWRGEYDLFFLDDFDEESAMQGLKSLPGVGAKIAATTLNFSALHKRTLPVDTHLLRVGKRLGLIPENADYEDGYEFYMRLVPDGWNADAVFEIHWLLKYHGQRTCKVDAPICGHCPMLDFCPQKNVQRIA